MSESSAPCHVVRSDQLEPADPTPGMERSRAWTTEHTWAGLLRTAAGTTSGWHHHGEFETALYVVDGALRMESGPAGQDVDDAGPGDFIYVPAGAIHRETNPTPGVATVVVVRCATGPGTGPPTVNVDGPAAQ